MRPRADAPIVAGWAAVLATIILVPASLWLMPRNFASDPANSLIAASLTRASGLVLGAVGMLIAVHRRTNRVGWILIGLGLVMPGIFLAGDGSRMVTEPRAAAFLAEIGQLGWETFLALACALMLLYPDGRLPSRRWRPLGWALAGKPVVALAGNLLAPNTYVGGSLGPNPLGGAPGGLGAFGQPLVSVSGPLIVPILVGLVAAVFVRWRRSRGIERQQLEVFAYVVLVILAGFLLALFFRQAGVLLIIDLPLFALPIAIAIAIFRYRLYDIDVVIRATVVYAVVSLALAATFFGGIVLLQALLRPFTGGNELAVAGSTLASVALFQPCARGSRAASTGASIARATTPRGRSKHSASGYATKSISTPFAAICLTRSSARCSRPTRACGSADETGAPGTAVLVIHTSRTSGGRSSARARVTAAREAELTPWPTARTRLPKRSASRSC